jgi:glycosyltransferase involved in cell wall biosynthesis
MEKRTVLIVCYNTLHNDPRILRQIDALEKEYKIITAGYSHPNKNVEFVKLEPFYHKVIDFYFKYPVLIRKGFALLTMVYLKMSMILKKLKKKLSHYLLPADTRYENGYWTGANKTNLERLRNVKTDVILANDIHTLPLAVKLKKGSVKLVFDAHEYSPGENDSDPNWVKHHKDEVIYQCKKCFSHVDLMFCVGYSIAAAYKTNFGISSTVITNASDLVDLKPVKNNALPIRLIHHGASIRERHLELMIEAMKLVDERYSLDLMLIPYDVLYLEELKEMSKPYPNINFIDPVPTDRIPYKLNDYDAGIIFIPPVNFNYEFCLPNKFYESVQGRLALILGPTKDMVDISEKYHNAVVSKDFSSRALADAILKLDPEFVYQMKLGSNKCAKDLNAEVNAEIIRKEVRQLLN